MKCLALTLKLDIAIVREFLSREEFHTLDTSPVSPAMSTGPVTVEFVSAWCRLLDLLSNPEDIPFLSGLIEREIVYRILRGPEGARLRAIATLETGAIARRRQSPGSRPTMRGHFALKNLPELREWQPLPFTIIPGRSRR